MEKGERIVEVGMIGDHIVVVFEDGKVAKIGSAELRPFAVDARELGVFDDDEDATLPAGA